MREMAYAVRNALQQSGGGASWRDELRRSPQHNTRVCRPFSASPLYLLLRADARRWRWICLMSLVPCLAFSQPRLDILWMLGEGGSPAAISADGELLVTILYRDYSPMWDLAIWDLPTNRLIRTLPRSTFWSERSQDTKIALSPDGARLAIRAVVGDYAETTVFALVNPSTGAMIRRYEFADSIGGPPAFSPDSAFVALPLSSYSTGNRLLIIRASDGQVVQEIAAPAFPITALRYLPDGRLLAAGVQGGYGYPWLWEVFSNSLRRIEHHRYWSYNTYWEFSPNGAYLVGYDRDSLLFALYDVNQARLIRSETRTDSYTISIEFSHDSHALIMALRQYDPATGWRSFLQVRQSSTGAILRQQDIGDAWPGPDLLAHPRRPEVFVEARIWNWVTGEWVGEVGHITLYEYVKPPLFSPDGQRLIVAGWREVSVWRLQDHALLYRLRFPEVHHCLVSPDGALLVVALPSEIRLYYLEDGSLRSILPVAGARAIRFSPDGALLAVGLYAETRLYRVADGALQGVLAARGTPLVFSPDGRYLVAGDTVWQLPEGVPVFTFNWLRGETATAAFSRDGSWLASGTLYEDGDWSWWDLRGDFQILRVGSWEPIVYRQADAAFHQLAFLPDGRHLVVGMNASGGWAEGSHRNGSLRIWQQPELAETISLVGLPTFTLSSTSRYLLAALHGSSASYKSPYSERNSLVLWRVHRGQVLQARQYEEGMASEVGRPFALAISPDERLIAYARSGGVVVVARNPLFTPYGDVNTDGCINDLDLIAVLSAFGSTESAPDINGDGQVDDADLLIVLFNFGAGC